MQMRLPGVSDARGGEAATARKHRLFFAIRPDVPACRDALASALMLRERHGLCGKLVRADRLHMTLLTFYDGRSVPPSGLVELAERAGAAATQSVQPFEVLLDVAFSFDHKPVDRPLVLSGQRGTQALSHFQRVALGSAMRGNALGALLQSRFVPHMTVLYDDHVVPAQAIDPVRWIVCELLLIHSHVGLTRHDVLGRWPFATA